MEVYVCPKVRCSACCFDEPNLPCGYHGLSMVLESEMPLRKKLYRKYKQFGRWFDKAGYHWLLIALILLNIGSSIANRNLGAFGGWLVAGMAEYKYFGRTAFWNKHWAKFYHEFYQEHLITMLDSKYRGRVVHLQGTEKLNGAKTFKYPVLFIGRELKMEGNFNLEQLTMAGATDHTLTMGSSRLNMAQAKKGKK